MDVPMLIPPRNLKLRSESVLVGGVVMLMAWRMTGFPLQLFHLHIPTKFNKSTEIIGIH